MSQAGCEYNSVLAEENNHLALAVDYVVIIV